MMSGPVVVDVFKERWIEDLDLGGGQRYLSKRYAEWCRKNVFRCDPRSFVC